MSKLVLTIDGANFSDMEGFYNEIDRVLTKDLDWNTGHNLNAFNDLLRGGFGVHDYEEPFKLIWLNSAKSKVDFQRSFPGEPTSMFEELIAIIREHQHIELTLT